MRYFASVPVLFLLAHASVISRQTLANEMAVLSIEDHKIPMVDVCLVVKAGSSYDPENKDGLAFLTARLLTYGTKTRSALEIAGQIEHLGSALNTGCTEDVITLRTKALSRNLEKVIEVMADCAINSQFADTEVGRIKGEMLSQIQRENDDPFAMVAKTYRSLLFGRHPYAHSPIGFDSTVKNIQRGDVVKYYQLTFAPENAFLVVVGDVDKTRLAELVGKYFGKWPRTAVAAGEPFLRDPAAATEPITGPRGKIVKKDISQSYILLGHYGVAGANPDWLAVRVMNYAFGGSSLTSRIGLLIREKKGLAYITYSYFERKRFAGLFACEVQTKNETGPEAVKLLVEEMKKMQTSGALPQELDDAKDYYTGNFPLRYDSYGEKVDMIITEVELYGGGLSYIDRFVDRIKAVGLDAVNQAARDYLYPDNYVLVVVGNISAADINLPEIAWEE